MAHVQVLPTGGAKGPRGRPVTALSLPVHLECGAKSSYEKKYKALLWLLISTLATLPAFSQTPDDPKPPSLPRKTSITTADKKTIPGVTLVESRDENGVTIVKDGEKTYIKYEDLWEGTAKYLQGTGPYVQYFPHLDPSAPKPDPSAPKTRVRSDIWAMFDLPDVVNLAEKNIPDDYKRQKITDTKGRSIPGEWLVIDRENKIVKFKREEGKEVEIPFATLSETDRRFAELETGYAWTLTVPFGLRVEEFTPEKLGEDSSRVFGLAFGTMRKAFTPQEVFDHLRVRTQLSKFVYDYFDYLVDHPDIQDTRLKTHFVLNRKSLTEVFSMLNYAEAVNEEVSLSGGIARLGIKPYEEKVPTDPVDRPDSSPHGIPRDSRLQALYFVAEYKNRTAGKPKTSLATLLANATPERPPGTRFNAYPNGFSGPNPYLDYDNDYVEIGLAKTYAFKNWSIPKFSNSGKENFAEFFGAKLARHQLRHNQPVVVKFIHPEKQEGGTRLSDAILTGFTTKDGETTYDMTVLKSATRYPFPPPKPFEVVEMRGVKGSEISFEAASFLD